MSLVLKVAPSVGGGWVTTNSIDKQLANPWHKRKDEYIVCGERMEAQFFFTTHRLQKDGKN